MTSPIPEYPVPAPARLVATLVVPLPFSGAGDAPHVEPFPGGQRLVQRGDAELVVRELGRTGVTGEAAPELRFRAPWPRRYGSCAVAPAGDLAVFAGPHALHAVDPAGAVRWELRHRCWAGCAGHEDFAEYADDPGHRYGGSGSAGFSADGTLVWAHVRGPLAEEWLVLDAADGRVLARTETRTSAAGSVHVPHPDPSQMGLTIGEGQDGSPLRWGRWDGQALTVDCFGDEDRVLMAVSPSGDRLLTVTHDQDTLAAHRVADGTVVAALGADTLPGHPDAHPDDEDEDDAAEVFFDYVGGFITEDVAVVGTVESDEEFGAGRHWLVDLKGMRLDDELTYPFPVTGQAHTLGDGTWFTASRTESALHVWSLATAYLEWWANPLTCLARIQIRVTATAGGGDGDEGGEWEAVITEPLDADAHGHLRRLLDDDPYFTLRLEDEEVIEVKVELLGAADRLRLAAVSDS
ncbi:hypothetical protein OOK31_39275 [Streptomyces sp. NBC_00249]|uniref:hypothetical protein n=1 Tax=Streptomyces sp. NBC_00249 TaxID=2975690 RepID=UPI00224D7993|nr:hypothetical protein [Streptomyces sp. NBC_00249]MCX5199847.1 hypothetical protein [Streptomyces sp. NBC_00249]